MMGTIHRRLLLLCLLYSVISCTAALTEQEQAELRTQFDQFDADKNGHITSTEIAEIMKALGESVPGYKIREMIKEVDLDENGQVEFNEFVQMYETVKSGKTKFALADLAEKAKKLIQGGQTEGSAEGTTHSFSEEEKVAFTDWINYKLEGDSDLSARLPISSEGPALFEAVKDGIILCKMINKAVPSTIDERTINKANLDPITINDNQQLAMNSASSIGANVVNIGPQDLIDGRPHLVLGLLWQIIKAGLMGRISLQNHPNLAVLLKEGESISDILALSPETILLRWFNYHLEQSGSSRRINNFGQEISDSELYTTLLTRVAPPDAGVDTSPMGESNLEQRARKLLEQAEKFGVRKFVQPKDIVKGNQRLNLAFVANIFNNYPALPAPSAGLPDFDLGDFAETREEKTFRNWMNSLGVDPYVNHLYTDLSDGLVLLQLLDKVKPGIVDWNRVNQKPSFKALGGDMKKLENCNYVVELAKQLKLSMVGIGGADIKDRNKTLTLAIIWQVLRAYTLSAIQKLAGSDKPIEDAEIIAWTNSKLSGASKPSTISNFKDPSISTSKPVIDLTDAIKPGSIRPEFVNSGVSEEDKKANAKYALSVARKIGARIYARPEDLVEVNHKMALTVFASLMARANQTGSSSREINLIRELLLLEKLLESE